MEFGTLLIIMEQCIAEKNKYTEKIEKIEAYNSKLESVISPLQDTMSSMNNIISIVESDIVISNNGGFDEGKISEANSIISSIVGNFENCIAELNSKIKEYESKISEIERTYNNAKSKLDSLKEV